MRKNIEGKITDLKFHFDSTVIEIGNANIIILFFEYIFKSGKISGCSNYVTVFFNLTEKKSDLYNKQTNDNSKKLLYITFNYNNRNYKFKGISRFFFLKDKTNYSYTVNDEKFSLYFNKEELIDVIRNDLEKIKGYYKKTPHKNHLNNIKDLQKLLAEYS